MIFDFVNFFFGLFNVKIMHCLYIFIFINLLYSTIQFKPILPSLYNKDTLPMNYPKIIPANFIKENTDIFLISTKDGYLHALDRNCKQIWKTYLEQELMSCPFSTRKLGKNFYLYPINEQLYIYKDGEFISFNIFIKDLVKKHFLTVSDFTLLGKTKTTLFIIDIDTGEIIQKIDDENNFSFKKRYILSKNKNTITVARVDYILNCLGIGEEQKFWNVTYSDILIQKGNENLPDNVKYVSPNLEEIIYDYNKFNINYDNGISYDNIVTAYSYFNKDFPPIKIFDRSDSQRFLRLDKTDEKNGEMKQLTEYNNQIKNNNFELIDEELKLKILDNFNNNDIIRQSNIISEDNNINNKNENNNNTNRNKYIFYIWNKIKNNWYLYVIIIFLLYELYYYKLFYYIMTNKEEKDNEIKHDLKNKNNRDNKSNEINMNEKEFGSNFIIDEEYNEFNKRPLGNSKTISIKHKTNFGNIQFKKYSYDRNKTENDIINAEEESIHENKIEGNINENTNEIIEDEQKENKNEINNSKLNYDLINTQNQKENSISSNKKKTGNEIWDDDDEDDDENNEDIINNNEKEDEIKNNQDNIDKEKSKNISKNLIWDDDDEEEEENEDGKEKTNNKLKKTQIKSKNNTIKKSKKEEESNEHQETNDKTNSKNSGEICNFKKEKKICRLDTDFENLEKIGQGGFGIVLKGKHRIDKDIYAIKIIDITYNSKECDEIISEAKKMNWIKGEYIVNYAICWYDDNLGSAEKFFEKQESNSSMYSSSNYLSKSITINFTKKSKNKFLNNIDEDIFNIKEVNEEENDEDNINNNIHLLPNKSKKKIENNSLELQENNNKNHIYNNRSKYCFEYRDDSRVLNNSTILRKYNEENHNQKDKKYFFILMEYCDGLTLADFISQHSNKTIERKIIYNYTRQILKGLKKLHKNGIIHRDIKPGNIFIKNEQIKIGDFGLATNFKKNTFLQTKDLRGFTPGYAAPEQINSKTYNEKIDIYATGITLFEMCSCFGTEMERQIALEKLKNKGEVSERIINDYPQETELIKMMTNEDYNERPSAEEILKSNSFIELGKIVSK